MTGESVYFWMPRLLSGVGACFNLVGMAKGCLRGPHEMYGWGSYAD
jgi:hypothetical protein